MGAGADPRLSISLARHDQRLLVEDIPGFFER